VTEFASSCSDVDAVAELCSVRMPGRVDASARHR
jgi:hypothetical protein